MNKGAIVRLVIWSVTALLLISVLIFGILFGGIGKDAGWKFSIKKNKYTYANEEKYTVGAGSISEPVNDIEINWIDGKVNVENYNGNTIEISETSVGEKDFQLRYLVEDGKLIIQYKKSGWSFGFTKSHNKELTVKIPSAINDSLTTFKIDSTSAEINVASVSTSDRFEIDNVSGTVCLKDIITKKCDIDTVSGEVSADNFKAESIECDTVSGDITVAGAFTKIDTDGTSGEINITSSICPTSFEADSVSGDIKLSIPECSGFTAKIDSVSGDFDSSFPTVKKSGKHIFGDGSSEFKFDTVSGDIFIKKTTAD